MKLGQLLLLTLLVQSAMAQPVKPPVRFDGLSRRIDSLVRVQKTPGVQVLIFSKDFTVFYALLIHQS